MHAACMGCAGNQGPCESDGRASICCLERGKRDLRGRLDAAVGQEIGVIPGYDDPGQNTGKETDGSTGGA